MKQVAAAHTLELTMAMTPPATSDIATMRSLEVMPFQTRSRLLMAFPFSVRSWPDLTAPKPTDAIRRRLALSVLSQRL